MSGCVGLPSTDGKNDDQAWPGAWDSRKALTDHPLNGVWSLGNDLYFVVEKHYLAHSTRLMSDGGPCFQIQPGRAECRKPFYKEGSKPVAGRELLRESRFAGSRAAQVNWPSPSERIRWQ
jgi:hypothetical protein